MQFSKEYCAFFNHSNEDIVRIFYCRHLFNTELWSQVGQKNADVLWAKTTVAGNHPRGHIGVAAVTTFAKGSTPPKARVHSGRPQYGPVAKPFFV